MKGPVDPNFVFLTFLSMLLVHLPPPVLPIISNKYMTFYIPEYSRRYIYLEGKYSYSVQLILHRGDPAHSYWGGPTSPTIGNITSRPSPEPVEFIIKAPEYAYYGIMAVIQRLHFRTSVDDHPSSEESSGCRDYIQFSAEGKGSSSIPPSPKLCGSLGRGNTEWSPSQLKNGPRTYFNPKGTIKLRVHVDPSQEDLAQLGSIGAEIVFTGYTACPGTEVGLQTLRPCSTQRILNPSQNLACIPSSLFCDSKIDCGFGDEFGLDETSSCYFPYIYGAAGLLILLILLLLIYGFVHWVRVKTRRTQQSQEAGGTSQGIEEDQGADPGMAMACDMDSSMGAF